MQSQLLAVEERARMCECACSEQSGLEMKKRMLWYMLLKGEYSKAVGVGARTRKRSLECCTQCDDDRKKRRVVCN